MIVSRGRHDHCPAVGGAASSRLLPGLALVCALLCGGWPGALLAQQDDQKAAAVEDDVDRLSLAALLMKDRHYQRAATVLEEIDESSDDLNRRRFYTLRGLVRLELSENSAAAEDLRRATEAGESRPIVWVYLAQALYRAERYQAAVRAIESSGETGAQMPGLLLLKYQAHRNLDQAGAAWETLAQGAERFPENSKFQRQQVFLLIELGLYRRAAELGGDFLSSQEAARDDYLAIGSALRRSGQLQAALSFLESARLRFPGDAELTQELAAAYKDRGDLAVAADLLEAAGRNKRELLADAAELHRRAGNLVRALYLNTLILDPAKKLKQRLAILLELNRYGMAATMDDDLRRTGLIPQEQQLLYAMAYAHFRLGDFETTEKLLTEITDSEIFRQATSLRKAMADCGDATWRCI